MAFVHTFPSHGFQSHGFAPARRRAPTRGFFRRLLDAMMVARQAEAEREIARYLQRTGGKFTDECEREIERLMTNRASW